LKSAAKTAAIRRFGLQMDRQERGRVDAHDLDDWLQAEDEIIKSNSRGIAA
jgi:hypothetical protein